MKKLFFSFLIFGLLFLGANPAFAAQKPYSPGSINGITGVETLQLIKSGYSDIQDVGNHHVSIYGETLTYKATDIVGVNFNLQYYTNGAWVTLDTISREGDNTDFYSARVDYTVTPGYTYRVATEHYAYDGSFRESAWSYSGGIYIQ